MLMTQAGWPAPKSTAGCAGAGGFVKGRDGEEAAGCYGSQGAEDDSGFEAWVGHDG
jgi:hypothetical protein